MNQRQKYHDGILHNLKTRQIARQKSFLYQELFLINLNKCLINWFDVIIADKKKQGKTLKLYYYDLWNYAPELQKILIESQGGKEK